MNEVVETDLSLRRMFCDFLCVSLLVVLARSEDNIEAQVGSHMKWKAVANMSKLQHYLNARKHANDFRKEAHSHLEKFEGGAKDDLKKKYATLLSFDFEAAARLKAWDDLGQIVDVRSSSFIEVVSFHADTTVGQECHVYGNTGTLEIITDILLCSQAPESSKSWCMHMCLS